MNTRLMLLFLVFLFTCFDSLHAQSGPTATDSPSLTVDLEVRPRLEFRSGFKTPLQHGQDPAVFVEQRSRVHLNYTTAPIMVRLVAQDVRIWGNQNSIYKSEANLINMYEAWAQYAFDGAWAVRFGRMELDYDNARFLGNLDWAQQGRSHDAVVIRYHNGSTGWSANLGATWNQANVTEPGKLSGNFYPLSGNNKTMQFVWLNRKFETGAVSVLLHNDARQRADTTIHFMQTLGINGFHQVGETTLRGEAYLQTGADGMGNDVSAYLLGFEVNRAFDARQLALGVDISSGSKRDATTNNAFNPLYGTNHKFYGFMDYFHVGNAFRQPGGTFDVGLINVFQKLSWNLDARSNLGVHVHQFVAPVDIFDATGNVMSSYLGTEMDIMFTWRPTPVAAFTFAYSVMVQTDTMNRIKSSTNAKDLQQWAFVMLLVRPRVLSQ